jgi:hypothetical protein
VLAEHVAAVAALDADAVLATFAPDALVNDLRREFRGIEAIRRWIQREIIGIELTMEVLEVFDHLGLTVFRARYDGVFDRTELPDDLVLSNYATVADGRITNLLITRNEPTPAWA